MTRLASIVDIVVAFSLIILLEYKTCVTERVSYISTEHPRITYYNNKYVKYVNMSSRRLGRRDRHYYVDVHWETNIELNNFVQWDFSFYEFSNYVYKPTFFKMHFGTCDLILNDKFIGSSLKRELKKCPLPAGVYHLYNFTVAIEHVPDGFPFTKGRIYTNSTLLPKTELIITGYMDIEVKQYTVRKQAGNQNG